MGAYQLKITIKGSKPPIWRRILVPEGITFEGLHQVIQTAFPGAVSTCINLNSVPRV